MDILDQNNGYRIIQDKKTVDWLIHNSYVWKFNPLTFEGYQRELEKPHWKKILKYMDESPFFFPTSIICACDEEYTDTTRLRIVDGQHRIHAFEEFSNTYSSKYDQIKGKELPVIVLEKIPLDKEIETFININKKGKKVDTSLATVLNHTITDSDDIDKKKAKIEYISVEVGRDLSIEENNIWENQICFEGNAKRHNQLISINAFVRSTKFLLSSLCNIGVLSIDWSTENELAECKKQCYDIIKEIWLIVKDKWPELFNKQNGMNSIIQGPIGYSSINKFIVFYINENPVENLNELINTIRMIFSKNTVTYEKWLSGEIKNGYSNYSSEAGYTIVAKDLIDNIVR